MNKTFWKRGSIVIGVFLLSGLTFSSKLHAQILEKHKVSIAVGGQSLLYYLPLTVAEQLGYFKDEGLQVDISDFAGGAKALQALIGGSADIVSGAYEHTISMQAKGQNIVAFVLQGRAPQIVFAVNNKTMPNYQSLSELKGKKIGVSAPGSSTNMMANFVLAKGGVKPTDVSFIGVGTGVGALTAIRAGRVDAIVNTDLVISMLQQTNDIKVIADTRTLKDTDAVFGGPMPAGTLYARDTFLKKYPHTAQALTNAMVRALKWLQDASPSDIVKVVPPNYLRGDQNLYINAFLKVREAMSPDGYFSDAGPKTALQALQAFDPHLAGKPIDLTRTYTNAFVDIANAKWVASTKKP